VNEPIRVLLVDDDKSFRESTRQRLAQKGFDVAEAANGPQALHLAQECGGAYDVAVIDQVMGPPNGIETMRRIKEFYPDIEVIILTGWGDMGPGEEAMQAGAYRYLSKPIGNLDELALNVRMAARYGQERQRRLTLETLVEAGRQIGMAESEDDLYERLYKEARELLPQLNTFVVTYYEEQSGLVSFLYCNVRGERRTVPPRQGGNGLTDYVLRNKEPLLLPRGGRDFRQEHHLQSPIAEVGHSKSAIVVPMFLEGRVWGTINAHTYEDGVRYTREHLEVLQAYAYQVAVALRNVRQLRVAERLQSAVAALARQRGKEAILRAIVTEAHNLTNYAYTSLIVHNQDGTLRKAPWTMPPDYDDPFDEPRQQDGLSRTVVESGEPLVIRDAQTDHRVQESMRAAGIRSILAMPMVNGSRVQGILYTHTLEPWYFAQYELDLWRAFASHAATVLHNAMEEEISEIWKTLDGELAICNNRNDVYRLFAERALEAVRADFAVHYPYDPTTPPDKSQCVLEDRVYVGDLRAPQQVPRGGRGGGVYAAIDRAPDGILIVNDLESREGTLRSRLAEREGVQAFVGLRLEVLPEGQAEPRTVGILLLNFRRRTHFERADLVGLQLAGSRVAAAIQRLYLLDVLQEQRQQLNARLRGVVEVFQGFRERQSDRWILQRIAQVARDSLGLDCCVLVEYDSEHDRFSGRGASGLRRPESDSWVPQVFKPWLLDAAGPAVVVDLTEDPRLQANDLLCNEDVQRLVICPVLVEGTPLGLLFGGYRCYKEVGPDQLEAIGLFANLAGLVIHEIRLQKALRQTQKRLDRRLFLDWVTMVENSWRHSLVGKAAAIRNHAAILHKQLDCSAPALLSENGVGETLSDIDRLAKEIADAPPRVPQSWELEEELIPLAPLLEEIAQREGRQPLTRNAARSEIMVEMDPLGGAQVRGYRRWLIYAFEGLLQNAYDALPEGGTVTILGQRQGRWAEVRVCDTGPGVPETVRNKLFQEPIPKKTGQRGMGIGGLLAATIVEDHEGSIELERSGSGGTIVLVRLPLAEETRG
jgi:GAF domain-containing protein/ActR/RegA family two-component response regulator